MIRRLIYSVAELISLSSPSEKKKREQRNMIMYCVREEYDGEF